eukprot:TRINITY_DN10965_c0_g2_i1.p1 TRINITY_DN10965_c0_g2~~TRINITY_DN10965_c0_g2_i1.p1  ORF type:complete len:345 (+),score=77.20 TRINITY_DN10965_c0_g2_i1:135-1037(+)
MGEHHEFWQNHESTERRQLKKLPIRKHELLALGRATELRAAVEVYMKEPASQVAAAGAVSKAAVALRRQPPQSTASAQVPRRAPPPPARRRSRSVGDSKAREGAALHRQRSLSSALDDQDAAIPSHLSAARCREFAPAQNDPLHAEDCHGEDADSASDSEDEDTPFEHASSFESTFDGLLMPSTHRGADEASALGANRALGSTQGMAEKQLEHSEAANDLGDSRSAASPALALDGHVPKFRRSVLRGRAAAADAAQQLEQDLPLRPVPPRSDDVFAQPQPRTYNRPLRAYVFPDEAARHE